MLSHKQTKKGKTPIFIDNSYTVYTINIEFVAKKKSIQIGCFSIF